ncbi:flagellar biosynthesis anti-sigma factor FlgM [Sulfuricurvum sp. RIFCSPLOWO2_12_FULL_43_24]|uniref:flagellar biosynthesis anti-sigma factor FlgM n=1 Tax=Sulfuricurvum sp. RIFCSPLOWO2_12_FULL_43_24 TaxID=1802247 RepID=UPI0008B14948|nr:flagellar biosynthesis anti-sigma factor FlgM [Sulfuricurvum sp. RIFCSPLOWO2_12_FULL_43_24]OHD87227.1 MAG: flagellar biosynthesis protein FlgM [Sulfuricurvum sp. RIFCSPLOWO2_12_43_5]OHD87453.1 MAG: flagellar biosynthesis protein FlgM [Sulfuricurvum sp. RIFCSPLOWO2_02_43_6]OHD90512.1 MAG: flagellar biosynthesis protein FlgM [Sulfuricurvum sp. RIFCSPLOWO2_12_FULL_43_24]
MISSVNGSLIRGAYQEQSQKTKEQEKSVQSITKQGDTSRIEELKASIEKGEYRVDIESLAKRIAQELT